MGKVAWPLTLERSIGESLSDTSPISEEREERRGGGRGGEKKDTL